MGAGDVLLVLAVVTLLFLVVALSIITAPPIPKYEPRIPYDPAKDACVLYLNRTLFTGLYCPSIDDNCSNISLPKMGEGFNVTWYSNGTEYRLACIWFELNNVSGYDWTLYVNGTGKAGCMFLNEGYVCHNVEYMREVLP